MAGGLGAHRPAPGLRQHAIGDPVAAIANLHGIRYGARRGTLGVFEDANEACTAAHEAFLQLQKAGVAARVKIVEIVKSMAESNAETWGKIELDETKIGRLDHKIEKLQVLGEKVPGVEFMQSEVFSGDHGLAVIEHAPFGVIGAITPVTHSLPTIACNGSRSTSCRRRSCRRRSSWSTSPAS